MNSRLRVASCQTCMLRPASWRETNLGIHVCSNCADMHRMYGRTFRREMPDCRDCGATAHDFYGAHQKPQCKTCAEAIYSKPELTSECSMCHTKVPTMTISHSMCRPCSFRYPSSP